MPPEAALHFRDALREARGATLRDSEAFNSIVHVIERLGNYLKPSWSGLGALKDPLTGLACRSPLALDIPTSYREFHIPFCDLFDQLRTARNAAVHEGAFARHLASHAAAIALTLEDALMRGYDCVADFMVRAPVCACLWHPLSFIRQTLLANSFSCLPVAVGPEDRPEWKFVLDCELARYLRAGDSAELKRRLGQRLTDAVGDDGLHLVDARTCPPDTLVVQVVSDIGQLPVPVLSPDGRQLLGMATAFDLL